MPAPKPSSDGALCLRVRRDEAGLRLDRFLVRRLAVSRAEARRLLEEGRVRAGGRALPASTKGRPVREGETFELRGFVPPAQRLPLPEPEVGLVVRAQGPGWIAVEKCPGQPVHPLRPGERGTLLGAVVARYPQVLAVGEGGLRSGVVHRLDLPTSGVVLFATAQRSWTRLRRAFAAGRVHKRYRALVLGELWGEGAVELPLVVARHRPARVRVARTRSQRAVRLARLSWRAVESFRGATLLEVFPTTGFLHQIRVSLAHLGHPLAGDLLYRESEREDPTGARRPMLHAAGLRFEEIRAESPDPPDLAELLARLRAAAARSEREAGIG